ncbi:MAG: serine hydrolase [Armatimonadota bacterium]|nr:serine hydrolase [Armatimonadota bacterium]
MSLSTLCPLSARILPATLLLPTLLLLPSPTHAADPPTAPAAMTATAAAPAPIPHVNHDWSAWAPFLEDRLAPEVGYAFVALQSGRVITSGSGGWARAPWEKQDPNIPFTLRTEMPIASVSKTITAVGLLKLWEEKNGDFRLDDPFWPLLRKIFPTADETVKTVTIRQLLTHRSGIEAEFHDQDGAEKILSSPTVSLPGSKFAYNNGNFYLVRLLIEQISGIEYTAYMQEHVLRKLGIRGMTNRAEAHAPTLAYLAAAEKKPGFLWTEDFTPRAGAEGWWGSVLDLARFLRGFSAHKVLSPATTDMMLTEGLGWYPAGAADRPAGYWHNGGWSASDGISSGGISSAIFHFRDGVDAVLFVNSQDIDAARLLSNAWLFHPLTVESAQPDGGLVLPAEEGRVLGGLAQLQTSGGIENIGYWTDQRDRVMWAVDVPEAGPYRVEARYACPEAQAGSTFRVEVSPSAEGITGVVAATGGWDQFGVATLPGTLFLHAGRQKLQVQVLSIPHAAVMNLQGLTLRPVNGDGR